MPKKAPRSQLRFFGQLLFVALLILSVYRFSSLFISHQTVAQAACGSARKGLTDNPIVAKYGTGGFPWTDKIRWNCVYNIQDYSGATMVDRFNAARDAAVSKGGGVVYFPAGTYTFTDSIFLKNGVVIRGETPSVTDAKSSSYLPPTKLEFPQYIPTLSGSGTPNTTAFKQISTTSKTTDSNIGLVNLDINRAGIDFSTSGNFDTNTNQNIIVFGIRNNNVAEPDPGVPQAYQNSWQRFSYRFAANIKIKAFANILVANNRLNDAVTDNYEQPGYQLRKPTGTQTVTYAEGWKALFNYTDHYGIVINRASAPALVTEPNVAPNSQFFRKGIVIQNNWVYHTMRIAIHASGDGLVIRNNQIRDRNNKVSWVAADGVRQPKNNNTLENRGIDWSGWNVLIEGNDYEVYRHKIMDGSYYSVDGEGILSQECCGGTSIKGATIRNNKGNSYIGLFKVPQIQNVLITGNQLSSNVTNTPLIYVSADTNNAPRHMDNVQILQNTISGSILAKASLGGTGNVIENNRSNGQGTLSYSCGIRVQGNVGFISSPCGIKGEL